MITILLTAMVAHQPAQFRLLTIVILQYHRAAVLIVLSTAIPVLIIPYAQFVVLVICLLLEFVRWTVL